MADVNLLFTDVEELDVAFGGCLLSLLAVCAAAASVSLYSGFSIRDVRIAS